MRSSPDELRDEYDLDAMLLQSGDRGKYALGYREGMSLIRLDQDVAEEFPDSERVNRALSALAGIIRETERGSA